MAPYSSSTVDALISNHPRVVYPPQYTANDEVMPLQQQETDIAAAVKSFSACGLDVLRPQHHKDMAGAALRADIAAAGQQLLTRLTDYTIIVLSGHVPKVVRPVFCGASLCALSKKDGGIRPTAVGCTLRRLDRRQGGL
jgi:hypothetical protein